VKIHQRAHWLPLFAILTPLGCAPDLLLGRSGEPGQGDAGPSAGGASGANGSAGASTGGLGGNTTDSGTAATGGAPEAGGTSATGGDGGTAGSGGASGNGSGATGGSDGGGTGGSGAMGGSSGTGATSPNPQCAAAGTGGSAPTACDRDYQSLAKSCTVDADCVLAIRYACPELGAESRAMGIQRSELPNFEALHQRCGTPTRAADCAGDHGCPTCWHATVTTDLDEPFQERSLATPWAACIGGQCRSMRSLCGPAVCGNSTLDSCTISAVSDPVIEPCDGTNLGGRTCRSERYGSGTLSCQAESCQLHEAGCDACFATGGRLADCQSKFAAGASDFAFAASERELVVAWLAGTAAGQSSLQVARFGPDLTRLTSERGPCLRTFDGAEVSIAPSDRGWVVALSQVDSGLSGAAVELHAFDENARHLGRVQRISGASYPVLAGRPGGPPLFAYIANDQLRAAVLSADLTTMTTPAALGRSASLASAVFVGDAFLVAGYLMNGPIKISRIGLDGALSGSYQLSGAAQNPRLTQTSAGPLLVQANNVTGHSDLARLDRLGAPVGAAIPVLPSEYSAGAAIGLDADVVVPIGTTLGGHWFSGGVNLVRLTSAGQVVWRVPIASSPRSVAKYKVVQRGPELVVGWITGDLAHEALGLARVTP
jgi:hypothetical protein